VIELTNCLWCDPGYSMCQIQYFLRMILLMVMFMQFYAANHDTQVVSVIDTSTNSVINTITVGSDPSGVGYDPDNGDIYVGVHGENYVSVINGSDNQVIGTINVGSGPVTPVYDPVHHNVYATNYAIRLNMLYKVAFRKISFTILGNFLAVTCSPNILLIDEKAVSAIHLCP